MAEQGAKIAATMVRKCHELDPTRVVSAAVNADNRKGISDAVDVVGFNYHLEFPDAFHKDNPTRPIFGSETSSAVSPRAANTPPMATQCGRCLPRRLWSKTPELWWKFYGERDWTGGRIRLDGLRLSRRADPIRLAVDQFQLRHC
jgi:beta-galactosidase